jgi:sporulation protein YlmC with PRC-barrel domain
LAIFVVSLDMISGKNVIGQGGDDLGEVKGAEINTNTWNVTHLQIKLSSKASDSLGFKKRFRSSTVCLPVSMVSAVGDVVTINKTLDELSNNQEVTECVE